MKTLVCFGRVGIGIDQEVGNPEFRSRMWPFNVRSTARHQPRKI